MKKYNALGMACVLSMIVLTGCADKQDKGEVISSTTTPVNNQVKNKYNDAYGKYDNETELGIVKYNPTDEDIRTLSVKDTYKYNDGEKDLVIIVPKFIGSEVTVSKVEYNGQRYVATEKLYTIEDTKEGYGLIIKDDDEATDIPKFMITVTYRHKTCEYIVIADSQKDIQYLTIDSEKPDIDFEVIEPIELAEYCKGLNKLNELAYDIDKDDVVEKIVLYGPSSQEEKLSQEEKQWALNIEKDDKAYPLFKKSYIQGESLKYDIYQDRSNYDKLHILIEYKTNAELYYYDCMVDDTTGNIVRKNILKAPKIDSLESWSLARKH